ncbi:hypothetical protein CCACVL1_08105, partial [Corchorus capsularis]
GVSLRCNVESRPRATTYGIAGLTAHVVTIAVNPAPVVVLTAPAATTSANAEK